MERNAVRSVIVVSDWEAAGGTVRELRVRALNVACILAPPATRRPCAC
jgi:hypothetical protein